MDKRSSKAPFTLSTGTRFTMKLPRYGQYICMNDIYILYSKKEFKESISHSNSISSLTNRRPIPQTGMYIREATKRPNPLQTNTTKPDAITCRPPVKVVIQYM
ncbi:Uu.00g053560.m01.CDS01 [Anthostomella pinea]|uniref:Uu.00g053560.m01.CDS01 n=1 Tax=Anthostomella pinea TaxID=933095 RepID=A0AAI8VQR3_9PEZI|nr:Uu.00g053560.m01.CDS01 [Anthostomella pinea]